MSAQPAPASDFGDALRTGLEALPSSHRFTPEQLEVLYALAYAHMQQQQWRQALNLFAFLSQYGPTRRHYLAGLAQCLRMAERHEEAINIWTLVLAAQQTLRQLAASLEDSDPLKVRAGALLVQLG